MLARGHKLYGELVSSMVVSNRVTERGNVMEATLTTRGYVYRLTFTKEEFKSLAWLADRYTTAEILWNHTELAGSMGSVEVWVMNLPESEAWSYQEALKEENGNPDQVLPTCVGGTLAEKLVELYESIV